VRAKKVGREVVKVRALKPENGAKTDKNLTPKEKRKARAEVLRGSRRATVFSGGLQNGQRFAYSE